MGFSTVLVISLAAGVILIVGGGLMMYMANLVKSAYEIKVQINTEVEEKLAKMIEDLDKKSRWIKRDLLEEIEKIKVNMQTDNATKLGDLTGPLLGRLDAMEALLRTEHADWVKAVESDRAAIANIDNRLKSVTKQVKKDPEAEPAATAPAAEPAMAANGAPPAAAKPPAAKPATPKQAASEWLPELGGAR